jgi:hypothetical protein
MALAYHRQLLDPSSVRTRGQRQNASSAYPLQTYPQNQTGGPYQPYQPGPPPQQGGWVPPYPGPPPAGSPFAPVPGYSHPDSKSDVPGYETTYEAQEQAWREAQQQGPTSHLTGNAQSNQYAPPPGSPPQDVHRGGGYVIDEEEDAWQRARAEGVTAHLTGDRLGESGRRVV